MGKLDRPRGAEKALLFVCEMCFKYMTDPSAYEAHTVRLPFFHARLSCRCPHRNPAQSNIRRGGEFIIKVVIQSGRWTGHQIKYVSKFPGG